MPVSQAALYSHGAGSCIESDGLVSLIRTLERDELSPAVGNFVEAVARAEDFQTILFFDELLDLVQGSG